jgi:hypothetical protein
MHGDEHDDLAALHAQACEQPDAIDAAGLRLILEHGTPPVAAAPGIVRLACTHLDLDEQLPLVRRAAAILRGYRTGDPVADTTLFWWEASTPQQLRILRWLLELSGPADARSELVSAAQLCGLVGGQPAMLLSAAVKRPPWADDETP